MNNLQRRHLAEMKKKKKVHLPPVKMKKIINKPQVWAAGCLDFCLPKIGKTVVPKGDQIVVHDRWGSQSAMPKKNPFACPFNFINRLEKRGYKVLGRGAYSTVLGKDGHDKVIKVSRTLDNWIDYVKWGTDKGYAGNFVPRVFSWKRHLSDRPDTEWERCRDWSVAVVERMDKCCDDMTVDMSLLLSLYYPAHKGNTMAKVYMEDLCPGSAKFFDELHKNGFASDVAGKNVMVRKDGSFCVTDPACGSIKTEKKRLRTGDFSPAPLLGGTHEIQRYRTNHLCIDRDIYCYTSGFTSAILSLRHQRFNDIL